MFALQIWSVRRKYMVFSLEWVTLEPFKDKDLPVSVVFAFHSKFMAVSFWYTRKCSLGNRKTFMYLQYEDAVEFIG